LSCFIKNKPFGFTYLYRKMLKNAKNRNEARIKIENAKADLLFLTTKDCNMWNTYEGSIELMDTLRKSRYQHSYNLVVYDDAGEPFAPAYLIPYGEGKLKIAPRLVFSIGGTSKGNSHAQVDSWYKAIEFLKG
jgi:BAAT / Acyl-CoA thioester hydrolase C terminal